MIGSETPAIFTTGWKRGNGAAMLSQDIDSAEKVFFRKSKKNTLHTDALYRTIEAWLIIFFIPNFRE